MSKDIAVVLGFLYCGMKEMKNMGDILIDNLSLYRMPIGDELDKNNYYVQKYLHALVLWDNLYAARQREYEYEYYQHRSYGYRDRFGSPDLPGVKNIEFPIHKYAKIAMQLAHEEMLNTRQRKRHNEDDFREIYIVLTDAIFYFLSGYNLGMDISLSSERAEIIKRKNIENYVFRRNDIINMLEKEVVEFYEEINRKVGKKIISFTSPLLTDYICQNASSFQEAVELALEIRDDKNVVQYRKSMDKMKECLNEGKFTEFNEYISAIPDIVNDIKGSNIKTRTIEAGLSITPSVTTAFNINVSKIKRNRLHMSFLNDLARYGMKERIEKI